MFFRQTFDVGFFLNLIDATELDRYEMDEGRSGICLVINNYNFPGVRKRQGAGIDELKIVDLFRDELHFKVEVLQNLPGSEILKASKEFAARDLSHFTAFVFIIMSHGDKDAIEGVDGAFVKVELLMSRFSMKECPTLRNKPKLFFIQACRGQLSDPRRDRLPTALGNTEGDGFAMNLCPDSALANGVTPLEADFLLSFATAPGYKSYRSQVVGSWYIQVSRCIQEKIRGQRGRLPVQALGYVNSTKVIFGLLKTAGVRFRLSRYMMIRQFRNGDRRGNTLCR